MTNPTTVYMSLDETTDSGAPGDNITNFTTLNIDGWIDDDLDSGQGTITLRDTDGTIIGTTPVAGDDFLGQPWFITTPQLAEGVHTLTATYTDEDGISSPDTLTVTIDTTPPPPPSTLALDPGSDSGTLGDDLTNHATPIIDGHGEIGDTVSLYDSDGITLLGTAIVTNAGTWSVTSARLDDGEHNITAIETDVAGNVSTISNTLSLTIKNSAPTPSMHLDPSTDSGVQGDNITNFNTLTIAGDDEDPSGTITLYNNGTIIGTTTLTADGPTNDWSITTGTLTPGVHNLAATDTDAAGNISNLASLTVTIDTTIPPAPVTLTLDPNSDTGTLEDDITSVTTPYIDGTATPGDTVSLYNSDGMTLLGTAVVSNDGTWTVHSSILTDGTYDLVATDTDAADNISPQSGTLAVTIDTSIPDPPSGLVLTPSSNSGSQTDNLTNITTPTITGVGTSGDTVTLSIGELQVGTTTVGPDGFWGITPEHLDDGTYDFTATQTNPAGTTSTSASDPLEVSIDTSIPATPSNLTLDNGSDSGLQGDGLTNIATPTIDGSGEAGDTVSLYDSDGITLLGTAVVSEAGTWSIVTTSLTDGEHNLTATETDAAANVSAISSALSLTIDTTPPSAPAAVALAAASDTGTLGDDVTSVATPTITGTGTAGDLVGLLDTNGTLLGEALVGADGSWSITSSTLQDGAHSITAVQVDPAGNHTAAASPLNLTIDTSTPVAPSGLTLDPASDSGPQGDDLTNVTTPTIDGTGTAGDTVALYDNGATTLLGTATVGADGTWSVTSIPLADGLHTLTATQINAAGTPSAQTSPLALTINSTADKQFTFQDNNLNTSGSFDGSAYTGPVSYLQAQYGYTGSDNVVIGASVPNAFLYSGSGNDALAAIGGSNVLSGGSGSNWLVGATGADGGTDTFFVDGRGGQDTWDTILNFHVGDMLTLFGYDPTTGSMNWLDQNGATNYQGATLETNFGDASGTTALVTFAGVSTSNATFVTSTGVTGGVDYLAVTRTA